MKRPVCLGCWRELGDMHTGWCPYSYYLGQIVTTKDTKPK